MMRLNAFVKHIPCSFSRLYHTELSPLITHSETRILPFKGIQLQSVVRDVPNYSKFVPFCQKSSINALLCPKLTDTHGAFVADLSIGFMALKCNYLSNVHYKPGMVQIIKNDVDPIFKELNVLWKIAELKDSECKLDFNIRFALANSLYNCTVGLLRNFLVVKMNEAFIERTYLLYSKNNVSERKIAAAPKKCVIDTKIMENLKALRESNKIVQEEFDAVLLMVDKQKCLCELTTIDRAYGGNKSCQELYAASLRKLMKKTNVL